jgi:hypothetical protein
MKTSQPAKLCDPGRRTFKGKGGDRSAVSPFFFISASDQETKDVNPAQFQASYFDSCDKALWWWVKSVDQALSE